MFLHQWEKFWPFETCRTLTAGSFCNKPPSSTSAGANNETLNINSAINLLRAPVVSFCGWSSFGSDTCPVRLTNTAAVALNRLVCLLGKLHLRICCFSSSSAPSRLGCCFVLHTYRNDQTLSCCNDIQHFLLLLSLSAAMCVSSLQRCSALQPRLLGKLMALLD